MLRNVNIHLVILGNITLQICNSVQILGFGFDNQLNFNKKINNVMRKEILNSSIISRNGKFIDKNSKIKLIL